MTCFNGFVLYIVWIFMDMVITLAWAYISRQAFDVKWEDLKAFFNIFTLYSINSSCTHTHTSTLCQ